MTSATQRDAMLALAEQLETFDEKVRSIIGNDGLSDSGKGIAIALLTTVQMRLFAESAAALRSIGRPS